MLIQLATVPTTGELTLVLFVKKHLIVVPLNMIRDDAQYTRAIMETMYLLIRTPPISPLTLVSSILSAWVPLMLNRSTIQMSTVSKASLRE